MISLHIGRLKGPSRRAEWRPAGWPSADGSGLRLLVMHMPSIRLRCGEPYVVRIIAGHG